MQPIDDSIPSLQNFLGGSPLLDFTLRFVLNAVVISLLIRGLYYPRYKNKDFVFTFFLFNIVNFLICLLLGSSTLKLGAAFGLFALFSIIRFRTVTVPVREMGYFFVSVAVGVINALAPAGDSYLLFLANGVLLLTTVALEKGLNLEHENVKAIRYERIDLIAPERRTEMLADLRQRTGLPIHRVEVLNIDFLRDVASIHAFYFAATNEGGALGREIED